METNMQVINLMAPVNHLGYGVVGYNILKELSTRAIVCFFPLGQSNWEGDPRAVELIKSTINNARFFGPQAPSLKIWHQNDMAVFPAGGQKIGWPIFELNRFDDLERHHLSSLDKIIVCSEWAKRVIEENNIKVPTYVVPLGVDTEIFNKNPLDKANRPYYTRDKVVFLNVGKWEVRKGHNELLEAFNKAFGPNDQIELWMLNENDFIGIENEVWKQKYIESKLGDKIRILPRKASQHQLKQLYNQVDFGVFPSHAEGWNLEILEMMACGAQIIATNYSGHTEFLNEQNALFVNPNGMQIAQDGKWFKGQGEWCSFDIDALAESLKFAYNSQRGPVKTVSGLIHEETVKKFSWQNTVTKLLEAIND
jgi:glycosyltransferase involved in cell wall biosynthesis